MSDENKIEWTVKTDGVCMYVNDKVVPSDIRVAKAFQSLQTEVEGLGGALLKANCESDDLRTEVEGLKDCFVEGDGLSTYMKLAAALSTKPPVRMEKHNALN